MNIYFLFSFITESILHAYDSLLSLKNVYKLIKSVYLVQDNTFPEKSWKNEIHKNKVSRIVFSPDVNSTIHSLSPSDPISRPFCCVSLHHRQTPLSHHIPDTHIFSSLT